MHRQRRDKRFLNTNLSGRAAIQPRKVLIVDDDYLIRWALAHALRDAGYEITAVEDGRKALELAGKEHFDFVVTDIAMPGINGWELLEMLVRMQAAPQVIIMTAYEEEDGPRRVKERGGVAYIEKSRLIESVKETLKAACNA